VAGFYIYYHSPYWLDMPKLWDNYPQNTNMKWYFKAYYLLQVSFWCQMAFVTLIEKWQKDFIQMMAHHFITIGLSGASYFFGYLNAGHVVLVEQDLADIFLPFAKIFKYFNEAGEKELTTVCGKLAKKNKFEGLNKLDTANEGLKSNKRGSAAWIEARKTKTMAISSIIEHGKSTGEAKVLAAAKFHEYRLNVHGTICDILFALFAVAWIPTRHGVFFWVVHSALYDCDRIIIEQGKAGWDPAAGKLHAPWYNVTAFMVVLGIFQCLMIMWLMDLLRAIMRALTKSDITEWDPHEADSDSEDEDEIKKKK